MKMNDQIKIEQMKISEQMKFNYQTMLDQTIKTIVAKNEVPTLLLHSCCGPCSSYVLQYLSQYFRITVFYYNPNIYPQEEYDRRAAEQQTLISAMDTQYPVTFVEGSFDSQRYYEVIQGLEGELEGGERCFRCYQLRLEEAARICKRDQYNYFTTTLSVSPYKNAQKLNQIGETLANSYGVKYLFSDFKKKNGYKSSIELSKEFGLYRQDYCGCVFSQRQSEKQD